MGLKVNNEGGGLNLEDGTYTGRCVSLIDLGTQEEEYQGKAIIKKKVVIGFELPTELNDETGDPLRISSFYTASLNEKSNLYNDLTAWRGRQFTAEELAGFELTNLLGAPALLTIGKSPTGKTKILGVAKIMKGMEVPEQIHPSETFDIDLFVSGDPDMAETFEGLPDFFKEKILASQEYKSQGMEPTPNEEDAKINEEDIPF